MVRVRLIDAGFTIAVVIRLPFSLSFKTWKYGIRHGGWFKAVRGGGSLL